VVEVQENEELPFLFCIRPSSSPDRLEGVRSTLNLNVRRPVPCS